MFEHDKMVPGLKMDIIVENARRIAVTGILDEHSSVILTLRICSLLNTSSETCPSRTHRT
jgi:hypothetical protein